jgi:hypothetical protein
MFDPIKSYGRWKEFRLHRCKWLIPGVQYRESPGGGRPHLTLGAWVVVGHNPVTQILQLTQKARLPCYVQYCVHFCRG